jgi:non-canonical (house-cleaning) NTP pyrophosphatase
LPQDECEQGVQLVISKECPSTAADVKALPAPVCELLKQEEIVDALCSKVSKYLPAQECSEVFALLVAKECPSQEPKALPAPVCQLLEQKEVVDALCSKVSKYLPQDECEQGVQLVISKECPSMTEDVKALPAPVCELLKQEEVVDAVCAKVAQFLPQEQCEGVLQMLEQKECAASVADVKELPAPVCELLKQEPVVDALCAKVSKFVPAEQCEGVVHMLAQKECAERAVLVV